MGLLVQYPYLSYCLFIEDTNKLPITNDVGGGINRALHPALCFPFLCHHSQSGPVPPQPRHSRSGPGALGPVPSYPPPPPLQVWPCSMPLLTLLWVWPHSTRPVIAPALLPPPLCSASSPPLPPPLGVWFHSTHLPSPATLGPALFPTPAAAPHPALLYTPNIRAYSPPPRCSGSGLILPTPSPPPLPIPHHVYVHVHLAHVHLPASPTIPSRSLFSLSASCSGGHQD